VAAADLVLSILIIGGSVVVLVLAAIVFIRSRGGGTARLFGRAVHRPRLWVAAAVCGGASGLLFEAQERLPGSWQGPGADVLSALEIAFAVLLFAHIGSHLRTMRSR
jgi:hypothetical protein